MQNIQCPWCSEYLSEYEINNLKLLKEYDDYKCESCGKISRVEFDWEDIGEGEEREIIILQPTRTL